MMPSREEWLGRLVDALRPTFAEHGHPLPERIRVSCGWPSRSALSRKSQRIGEAWSQRCSDDGTHETFLSPVLADPIEVGAVLVHELVHHAVGVEHGHRGPFRKLALSVGLEGPMTATTAGEELQERLHALSAVLGPYPHAKLSGAPGRKKQTTRMLKVACEACGCIVRMTRQWLDQVGAPTCACGGSMAEGGAR
ncbi:MAG: transcription elongation protein SprT [Planctomycetes bacterium]|nr:transcription elongation protein SprT [Planctomycetota bacterium]